MEEMSNESWEALNNTVFVAKEIWKVLGLVVQMTRMGDLGLSKMAMEMARPDPSEYETYD